MKKTTVGEVRKKGNSETLAKLRGWEIRTDKDLPPDTTVVKLDEAEWKRVFHNCPDCGDGVHGQDPLCDFHWKEYLGMHAGARGHTDYKETPYWLKEEHDNG